MTDTVNVPVEALNAALDALDLENKESDFFVSEHYDELRRHLLAAAPKAEPVSDPYKLEFEPCYGCGANEPSERCLGCSHDFPIMNRQETIDSSEAPKVEQEPVICHHEAYQGYCAHCGVKIVNGFAVMPMAHPAPSSELLEAADFLADRVTDHEHSLEADDFYGHVLPALSRYRLAKHKGPQS